MRRPVSRSTASMRFRMVCRWTCKASAVGTIGTLATMIYVGDIYANEPIYVGLASGLVVYVVGSLASKPTDPQVLAEWDRRSRGQDAETAPTLVS